MSDQNEAVIVSTARTPIGKAYRGALNVTHGATLGGHAVSARGRAARPRPGRGRRRDHGLLHARRRDRHNIARQVALRAGLPVTTSGTDHQPVLQHRACRRSRWPPSA